MRYLMWLAIGFAGGCGVNAYGMGEAWFFPALIGITAALAGGAALSKTRKALRPGILVLIGWILGTVWFLGYHTTHYKPLESYDGKELELAVTAADYSELTDSGSRLDGIVTLEGKEYRVKLWLKEETTLSPGDRVHSTFRVRWSGTKEENGSYYLSKGTPLLLSQKGELTIAQATEIPGKFFPVRLRHTILTLLDELFLEDVAPFVRALLLGDTSALSYGLDTAFRVSGIRHIIAVSGLHIAILYSILSLITLRQRYLTAAVAMPVLLLFAAVAGFTPSVTRACFMVSLMLLAKVFDREYDSATALSVSVLLMLLHNPWVIASVSFQLSVLCVAGILLFQGRLLGWFQKVIPGRKSVFKKFHSALCGSLAVSISAMSLVTPLSALYFGAVSILGVVTNVLLLWVVNLVFHGLAAVCVLYWILPKAGVFVAGVMVWPARLVMETAEAIASIPFASVYIRSIYITLWLILIYVLLGLFLLMKDRKPAHLICCGCIGLCIALLASWTEPMLDDTRITMLDVGQGQSILLQSEGKTFLVDCGGNNPETTADIIAETLLSQGIRHLDGIILTHYDNDHSGALSCLLSRMDTDLLFLPDTVNEMPLPETDGQIIWVWEDLQISFGTAVLTVFGPITSGNDNENSLCVLFDTENCDILITGDRAGFGERMLCRKGLPHVDILVAGHHGAKTSTTEELLQAVSPEMVLISVGEDNPHGHPNPELLQRLASYGCAVYRTDHHGTITIRR